MKPAKLVAHIRRTLGDLSIPLPESEYPYAATGLCVIDAVFSLGVRYESTWRTVCDWCEKYGWEKDRRRASCERTMSDLLAVLQPYENRWGAMADEVFRNRQRTSSRSGILKAEAVYKFAKVLQRFRIETFADALRQARNDSLRRAITSIPGQASGLSFNYFLILAGDTDAVKADRMVTRFVSDALAVKTVPTEICERLVREASSVLKPDFPKLTPSLLDHAIWEYQRDQDAAASERCSRSASA